MEQYPAVIQTLIRGKSGVYALYNGDRLYYVGLASNLMGRLKGHVRDRHEGLWNRFSVYLTAHSEQSHIRELDALLLRITKPAEAIAQCRVNGRWFWRFDVNGEWVRLKVRVRMRTKP